MRRKGVANWEPKTQAVEADGETQRRAVCLMETSHYSVSGSIGSHTSNMRPLLITADTGAGCNLIRKDHPPEDWQRFPVYDPKLPEIGDANGNLIHIEAVVQLSVRLGNMIYRVPFLVAEQLAVVALLGTSFMNKHVDHIWCRSQEIDLHQGCTIPILQAHRGYQTEPDPSDGEPPIATQRPRKKKMQETPTVRMTAHVRVPPMTQMPVEVDSRASSLAFLEPKLAQQDVKQVRMANGIIEATPGKRFRVLLSNLSRHLRRFPKRTVLGYAARNPINIVTPDREVATHFGEVFYIDPLEQCETHE